MQCPKCHSECPPEFDFCPRCGALAFEIDAGRELRVLELEID